MMISNYILIQYLLSRKTKLNPQNIWISTYQLNNTFQATVIDYGALINYEETNLQVNG